MLRLAIFTFLFVCGTAIAADKELVYSQTSGTITLDGKMIGKGYSGHGKGLNNPDREKERNVGPIPAGEYSVGKVFKHDSKGPIVMRLTPTGHTAHGRDGFLIHGDNPDGNKSASEGCIILGPEVRKKIADSGVTKLRVVKE